LDKIYEPTLNNHFDRRDNHSLPSSVNFEYTYQGLWSRKIIQRACGVDKENDFNQYQVELPWGQKSFLERFFV
jgi:hypothetical protein